MSPQPDPREWLRFAQADLRAARKLQGEDAALGQAVGFHAQQAVEKAIKALLIRSGVRFPFTHDLRQLFELYERHAGPVPLDLNALDALTPFAGHLRYPSWIRQPDPSEQERLVALAGEVVAWAEALIHSPEPPQAPTPSQRRD